MKANFIAKTANAIQAYLETAGSQQVLIAAELVQPSAPDNRTLAGVYYATQWGITIEWLVKSRRAYKRNGWGGVAKQYAVSACKAWAIDHYVRRATVELMEANTKAAKDAELAKANTDFNVEMDNVIRQVFRGVELQLNSSL